MEDVKELEVSSRPSAHRGAKLERDSTDTMIRRILDSVPYNIAVSIGEIAKKTGYSHESVSDWIGRIETIQAEATFEVTRGKNQTLIKKRSP